MADSESIVVAFEDLAIDSMVIAKSRALLVDFRLRGLHGGLPVGLHYSLVLFSDGGRWNNNGTAGSKSSSAKSLLSPIIEGWAAGSNKERRRNHPLLSLCI